MTAAVPFIDLQVQHEAIKEEILEAIQSVLESQKFILGPGVQSFEEDLAKWMGLAEGGVVGVSSGTDALLASLMALGVGPGDEVLTTPFSFFATAGVIARLHAKPVFVDIDPRSFNLNTEKLVDLEPGRFKACILVHLYGRYADVVGLKAWAESSGLPIIEDAAQAIGVRDSGGRHCGTIGDFGCFSFFPTKNLGGAGDGGCVVTTNERLLEDLRRIRVHGAVKAYESQVIGGNFRLDAIQAAILQVKLRHLSSWTEARRSNARYYNRRFKEEGLEDVLHLPVIGETCDYVAHQYVIRSSDRDALKAHLHSQSVASAVYYPQPFHLMASFSNLGYSTGDFPETERACREVLALPIFPELGEERLERVVESVVAFHQKP